MSRILEWLRRLYFLVHRRRMEDDLRREMESHRAMMAEPGRFGNTLRLREESRDAWRWTWLDDLSKDLRYGAYQLRRTPAFTVLALLTLAVGIGANTAVFGLGNAMLFAELPVRNPEELKQVEWSTRARPGFSQRGVQKFSYPVYEYVRNRAVVMRDPVCLSSRIAVGVRIGGATVERASVQFVSDNFLQMLGVSAGAGRVFSPDDNRADADAAGLLSDGAWKEWFAGDPQVLGKTLFVNEVPIVVVGVLPPGFYAESAAPGWTPHVTLPMGHYSRVMASRGLVSEDTPCRIIGRLGPESTEEQARAEMQTLVQHALTANPPQIDRARRQMQQEELAAVKVGLRGMGRAIDQLDRRDVQDGWPAALAILLILGSVLLIACTNIAGMLLARSTTRRGEITTRLALGASRRRIIRQLLTESALLAVTGGVLGLGLCFVLQRLVPLLAPDAPTLALDFRVLAASTALSLLTGLAFGFAPALHATRMDLHSGIKLDSPGARRRGGFTAGRVLVGIQVLLSVLLLVTAGLQLGFMAGLLDSSDLEPENVLTVEADPGASGYAPDRLRRYFQEALSRAGSIGSVVSASVSEGDIIRNTMARASDGERIEAFAEHVAPRYFETMRIPLIAGRDVTWNDGQGSTGVAIVNQAFATAFLPGASPLGQTLRAADRDVTIIGLAADSSNTIGDLAPGKGVDPTVYFPLQQQERGSLGGMTLVLRTGVPARTLLSAVEREVRAIDANVPVGKAETQESQLLVYIHQQQILVTVLVFFGLAALAEASFGIYGSLSYFVNQRIPEIGIRLALGAKRSDIVRTVLWQSLKPVILGITAGICASPIVAQLMKVSGIIAGVTASEQFTIVSAAGALVLIAATAASAPARRVSRIDPMQALRHH